VYLWLYAVKKEDKLQNIICITEVTKQQLKISDITDVFACTPMWIGFVEALVLRVSSLMLSRAPCPAGNGFPMEQWTTLSTGLHVYIAEPCSA